MQPESCREANNKSRTDTAGIQGTKYLNRLFMVKLLDHLSLTSMTMQCLDNGHHTGEEHQSPKVEHHQSTKVEHQTTKVSVTFSKNHFK